MICKHIDTVQVEAGWKYIKCTYNADGRNRDSRQIPGYCRQHEDFHRLPIRTFASVGLETTGFTS